MMLKELQKQSEKEAGQEKDWEVLSFQEKMMSTLKKGALNFESCFRYAWIPFIIGLSLTFSSQIQDPVSGQVQEKPTKNKIAESLAACVPMLDVSFIGKVIGKK